MQEWFIDSPPYGIGLPHLLPSQCSTVSVDHHEIGLPEKLSQTVHFYKEGLPHTVVFPTEYRMWVRKWIDCSSAESPNTLVDTLKACDPTTFPNIHILLQLALTLPITFCESERSFSQLKLLKTAHRSTMTADRFFACKLNIVNYNIIYHKIT